MKSLACSFVQSEKGQHHFREHQLVHCNRFLLWPFQLKTFITSEPQSFLLAHVWFDSSLWLLHKHLEKWWEFNEECLAFEEHKSLPRNLGYCSWNCLLFWKKLQKVFLSIIFFFNKSTLENYFTELQMFHCLLVLSKYLKCPFHLSKLLWSWLQ